MQRDDVIQVLRDQEAELRKAGVIHAALFGSTARGEATDGSDIDLFIEFEPQQRVSLWKVSAVVDYLQSLFNVPVDVAERQALHDHVRPTAERDAVFAF